MEGAPGPEPEPEPAVGRKRRIAIVALLFVGSALRGRINQHDAQTTTTDHHARGGGGGIVTGYYGRGGGNNNNGTAEFDNGEKFSSSSSFCFGSGSLHHMALDMFRYSSPPGSRSYDKLKRVLDANTEFYVDYGDLDRLVLFVKNVETTARLLRGHGLRQAMSPRDNDVTLVETAFTSSSCDVLEADCRDRPRILIQTEQYPNALEKKFLACHSSPNCVILEFSDFNYRSARDHPEVRDLADSFVLLPIMHQTPSRLEPWEPKLGEVPKELGDRTVDMIFFGLIITSSRRNVLTEGTKAYEAAHPGRTASVLMNWEKPFIADQYREAKVCLMAHHHTDTAGGEYHRMSEFGPFGCIPVAERFMDTIGIDAYEKCAGMVFTNLTDVMGKATEIVSEIDRGLYKGRAAQIKEWWKMGIQWERILPTVFAAQ